MLDPDWFARYQAHVLCSVLLARRSCTYFILHLFVLIIFKTIFLTEYTIKIPQHTSVLGNRKHDKQDTWAGVNLHCRVANLRKVAREVFGNSYRAFNR